MDTNRGRRPRITQMSRIFGMIYGTGQAQCSRSSWLNLSVDIRVIRGSHSFVLDIALFHSHRSCVSWAEKSSQGLTTNGHQEKEKNHGCHGYSEQRSFTTRI